MTETLTGEDEDGNPKTVKWQRLTELTRAAIDDDFHALFDKLCRSSSADIETEADREIAGIDSDRITVSASVDILNQATLEPSARRPLTEPTPVDELDVASDTSSESDSDIQPPAPKEPVKIVPKAAKSTAPSASEVKDRANRVSGLLAKCKANEKLKMEPRTKKQKR